MSYGLNKFSTRTKLIAGALALILAGASHAGTTQVGGGGTLASIGYVGNNAVSNLQVWDGTGSPATIATGSLFGQYVAGTGNPNVSYCLSGSGAGKDILAGGTIGTNTYSVQNACAKNTGGTVTGFGAGLSGVNRTDLTQPNFAGADAPLSSTDYANYQTGHGSTADFPTEFPAVAGSIAIVFNLVDDQGTRVTAANFSDSQLCNIFSGADATWNSSDLSTAFTLPAGHTATSAIKLVYRSDGSGTTFSFANHLSTVCSGTAAKHFVTDQSFANVDSLYGIPTGAVPESGNAAIITGVEGTASSIGYTETANYEQAQVVSPSTSITLAEVNSKLPTSDFNVTITINASDLAFNSGITGANATTGVATVGAFSPAPTTQCIALVQPSHYAAPGTIVPTGSYPIVAISYLLGNAQGNGTDLANTRKLVEFPYTVTHSTVSTIGGSTGLQFLALGARSFTATQVGTCLAN